MRDIDQKVLKAQNDSEYLEVFIKEYDPFIMKTAQRTVGRYLTKSDDQWSISLSAFHEAVKSYSFDKGAFLPFAEMVIKRRLYDHVRKESRHFNEVSIESFSAEGMKSISGILESEVIEKLTAPETQDANLEIQAVIQTLKEYGFSFFDLIAVSPKAEKTKSACGKAIFYISQNTVLIEEMRRTKTLPLKILEKNCDIPRKILERHRKYIIAGAEIIAGDYPILAEYFSYARRERST